MQMQANGKCISGAGPNCPSKINNYSDRDFGCPDPCWTSLWIKSRVFDDFMSFPSENLIFHGVEEVSWVTDLLRQILTNKKASFGWVEVRGTLGGVTERSYKLGTVRWQEGGFQTVEIKISAWIYGWGFKKQGDSGWKISPKCDLLVQFFPAMGDHGEVTRETSVVSQEALWWTPAQERPPERLKGELRIQNKIEEAAGK